MRNMMKSNVFIMNSWKRKIHLMSDKEISGLGLS